MGKKRLRSLDSKLAKYASLMSEVLKSPSPIPGPSTQADPQPGPSREPTGQSSSDNTLKRKPKEVSCEPGEPPRKKKRSSDESSGDSSTDAEETKEHRTVRVVTDASDDNETDNTSKRKIKKDKREVHKKLKKEKKQKRKENEKANKYELSEDGNSPREEEIEDKEVEEDLDILDLNIGKEDIDILEEESSSEKETRAPLKSKKRSNSESKVTTTVATSSFEDGEQVEEKRDEFEDDPERRLQAAVLAQARKHRFAQTEVRGREVSSPSVSSTTNASNYSNLPLPRYAYSYSRTFITPEQKAEHFPNLFNRFYVPLDTSEDDSSDSECEEGFCEGVGRLVTELPLVLLLRSLRMSRQGSPR